MMYQANADKEQKQGIKTKNQNPRNFHLAALQNESTLPRFILILHSTRILFILSSYS